jgi:hypothetical protein
MYLREIQWCKETWMKHEGKTTNDTPTWADLNEDLVGMGWRNGKPVCPNGGVYTIGRVADMPTCSIGGPKHSDPFGSPLTIVTN